MSSSPSIRVIIAEDDPQIAEIQQRFLGRIEGFELVGIAYSLTDASDLIEVLQPELVLLDIQFPKGTGLDLLRELRASNTKTDVILITAAKEVSILQEALHGGVFDYILKPLVFERLQESLQNFATHLAKLRSLEALEQSEVDNLLPRDSRTTSAAETPVEPEQRLPKGVNPLTLNKIRSVFPTLKEGMSAEEVGELIGASRTTARRYLEYLISTKELVAEVDYGSIGRPERRYRRV